MNLMRLIQNLDIDHWVRSFWLPALAIQLAVFVLSSCTSPGPSITNREIVDLAASRNYEVLEQQLTGLQEAFEADEKHERRINKAFDAFSTSDPALKKFLDEWVGQKPGSYAALTARGVYNSHLGWLSRGTRYVGRTHPERFAAMKRHFKAAQHDLRAALKQNNKIVKAYNLLMSYEVTLGRRAELRRIYKEGIAALPRSSGLHFNWLQSLDRRWGGSHRAMDEFFEFAERQGKHNPGYRLVAQWREYYLADRAYFEDRYTEALAHSDKAIRAVYTAGVSEQRARILLRLGRESEALEELRRGTALDSQNADIRAFAADVLRYSNRTADALTQMNAALALDPLHPSWLARRAKLLLKLRRLDDAERDLDDALVFGRYEPTVHAKRGRFFRMYRKNMRLASFAYRQARDLAPDEIGYWEAYSQTLYALRDCGYLPVSAQFIEMCVKSGKCTEGHVRGMTSIGQNFKKQNSCKAKVTASSALSLFTASSDVRRMALSDLKLNAPLDAVLRQFPTMKFEQRDHPGGPGVPHMQVGRHKSDDESFYSTAVLSQDGRLIEIFTKRAFILEESFAQIGARYIEKYGKPDRMHLGEHLEMDYKQADSAGRTLARMEIRVWPVRNPVENCRLPLHLRDGRSVAHMRARLIDVARSIENTNKTLSEVRLRKVDAKQLHEANRERSMRDLIARQQAAGAPGC